MKLLKYWFLSIPSLLSVLSTVTANGVQLCRTDRTIDPVLINYVGANEQPFCMNGGTCKSDFEDSPDFPCDCPDGVTGPHCEFDHLFPPPCNLTCENGGICQVGIRSHLDLAWLLPPENYNYCICMDGFYGPRCEVAGKQCGTTHCLNGGNCVQIHHQDGTVTDHCDCNTAEKDGKKYVGRFCQTAHSSTCSDHDYSSAEPTNYCANGGICNVEPWRGCQCPEGFYGALCEFQQKEEGEWSCNMECGLHGFCRKGVKDTSFIDNFNFGNRRLTQRFNQQLEYCTCEPGWVGLACDVQMTVCPGRSTICLNGASCAISLDNPGSFECSCTSANADGYMYAGKHCQYHATSYCTADGLKPKKGGNNAFCTNHGRCVGFVTDDQPHPGCICDSNYEGDRCEILIGTGDKSSSIDDDNSIDNALLFAIIFGLLGAILLCIFLIVAYRQRRLRAMSMKSAMDEPEGFGKFSDRWQKKSRKGKSPYNPELESIYEEAYGKDYDNDNRILELEAIGTARGSETSISSRSGSVRSGSDSYSQNEMAEFDNMDGLQPFGTLNHLESFGLPRDSEQETPIFENTEASEDAYPVVQSNTFDSGYRDIKSDYSFDSVSYLKPAPTDSQDESDSHPQGNRSRTGDSEDLEEMVQKRRRVSDQAKAGGNRGQHQGGSTASSEIESMSSMGSSSDGFGKKIQAVNSFGSYPREHAILTKLSSDDGGSIGGEYSLDGMDSVSKSMGSPKSFVPNSPRSSSTSQSASQGSEPRQLPASSVKGKDATIADQSLTPALEGSGATGLPRSTSKGSVGSSFVFPSSKESERKELPPTSPEGKVAPTVIVGGDSVLSTQTTSGPKTLPPVSLEEKAAAGAGQSPASSVKGTVPGTMVKTIPGPTGNAAHGQREDSSVANKSVPTGKSGGFNQKGVAERSAQYAALATPTDSGDSKHPWKNSNAPINNASLVPSPPVRQSTRSSSSSSVKSTSSSSGKVPASISGDSEDSQGSSTFSSGTGGTPQIQEKPTSKKESGSS